MTMRLYRSYPEEALVCTADVGPIGSKAVVPDHFVSGSSCRIAMALYGACT
jgi:hypothetical protein